MGVYIIKKDALEITYADDVMVIKYENLLVVVRPKQNELNQLNVLPEHVQDIVKTVIQKVSSLEEQ